MLYHTTLSLHHPRDSHETAGCQTPFRQQFDAASDHVRMSSCRSWTMTADATRYTAPPTSRIRFGFLPHLEEPL